ncbi:MAG: hypothetical protein JJE15_03255 [Desulfobacteraceae bacterium]|nr:hypothetical protein [Desulfobacteraceae bacterium]
MAPNLAWGKTLAQVLGDAQEHITYIELPYPGGEEGDVVTADRSHIQQLPLPPPLEAIGEQP